jgi:hypothetical protein
MPAGRRRCSLIEGGWIALLRTSNFLFATLARPWAEKGKAVDSLECLPVRRGREVPQYYYETIHTTTRRTEAQCHSFSLADLGSQAGDKNSYSSLRSTSNAIASSVTGEGALFHPFPCAGRLRLKRILLWPGSRTLRRQKGGGAAELETDLEIPRAI